MRFCHSCAMALPAAEGKSFEVASNNPAKIQVMSSGAVYLDGIAAGSDNLDQSLGPMLRARRTAEAVLKSNQHLDRLRIDSDLQEVRTSWEGEPVASLEGIDWDFYAHPRHPEFLQTLPHVHGTSGFFIARLRS